MPDIAWLKDKTRPIAIKYGLNKMYLFGSYAKGNANEESDIDILLGNCETRGARSQS